MKSRKHYSIFDKEKIGAFAALVIVMILIGFVVGSLCHGENEMTECWVMCRPGSQVNVRKNPNKKSETVGYLDACDSFRTDGTTSDGWVRVFDIGEYGAGWVYVGYVVTEEPKPVFGNYVCVAKKQAAIRKWIGGPYIDGKHWLKNGSNVSVFYIADGWAITSRGFIQAEWLEANPL